MLAGGPALLVRLYAAFVARPVTEAFTVYAPAVEFAVKAGAVATPLALVVKVAVAPVPGAANIPLAPLAGAVNVTEAPLIGLPPLSVTVACRATPNALLIVAFCVAPAVAEIFAGGPGVLFSENVAFVTRPVTDAFTM
jgi:hypothetical protein